MKLDELRRALQSHSEEDLGTIIAELYKNLPKSVREDAAIGELITKPRDYFNKDKPVKAGKTAALDESLVNEIRDFLVHAKARHYCIPNKWIHKKERPKWRFKAMSYYKLLVAVSLSDLAANKNDNLELAGELLESLYRIMCYGCRYQIFSGDDPFASTGIPQTEFLGQLLPVKLETLMPTEFISLAIDLINEGTDRNTSTRQLIEVFQKQLKIPDMREAAIAECERGIEKALVPQKDEMKKTYSWNSDDYDRRERISVLVEICFFCCVNLGEIDRGIEFYKKYYREYDDPEIKLYCLLDLLRSQDLKEIWIREYESATKIGIEPRDNLQVTYQHIKERNDFPQYSLY